MQTLLVFALVGFGAQLVDGALGMAYGVTSTSLLLVAGVNPATASASVHLAEVGTTLAAGAPHWRFGNVDWRLVLRLGVPGAVGAFLGATVLSALSTENAAPVHGRRPARAGPLRPDPVLGAAAQGGHGTGVAAPSPVPLAAGPGRRLRRRVGRRRLGPGGHSRAADRRQDRPAHRDRVGGHLEFLVALAASIGFLIGLGSEVLDPFTIGGLLLGGVLAAPLAAWLVTKIPAPVLGSLVGGIIVLTNTRTILRALEVSENWRATVYAVVVGIWIASVALAISKVVRGAPVEVVGEPTTDQPTTAEERDEAVDDEARAVAGRLRSTARATASL